MTTVAQRLLIAGVAAAITLGGASVLVMPDDEHAARDKPEQQTNGGPVVGQTEVVATLPKPGHDGNGIADGEAQSGKGLSIAAGPDGTLYVADADGRRIREIDTDGTIRTLFDAGKSDQYGKVSQAIATSGDGKVYFGAELHGRQGLCVADRHGNVKQLADAFPTDAFASRIDDIAVDRHGTVYLASSDRFVGRLDTHGKVTTLVTADDLPTDLPASTPDDEHFDDEPSFAIATDNAGNVVAADSRAASLWRITPDGTVTRLVGARGTGNSGHGGPADQAQVSQHLTDVAVDDEGTIYFVDAGNSSIKRIDADGTITSIAPAIHLHRPVRNIAIGPDGDILGSTHPQIVRVGTRRAQPGAAPQPSTWSPVAGADTGTVRTVAGGGHQGSRDDETFESSPPPVDTIPEHGLAPIGKGAVGPDGSYYIAEPARHVVSKIAPDGTRTVVAGTGNMGTEFSAADGEPARETDLSAPSSVAVGDDGELFIADPGAQRVWRVGPDGTIGTYLKTVDVQAPAGKGETTDISPTDVELDRHGQLYVADAGNAHIVKVSPAGKVTTVAGGGGSYAARLARQAIVEQPTALAVADDGTVYFAERWSSGPLHAVRGVRPDGRIFTVAGGFDDLGGYDGDGGQAPSARLNAPADLAVGPDGTLYIADSKNNRVRAVDRSGRISTVAGTGERTTSGDKGPATAAALHEPITVDVGSDGALVVGTSDRRIRVIDDGTISTLIDLREAGDQQAPRATDVQLNVVSSAAVDPTTGELYFADSGRFYRVDRAGRMHPVDSPALLSLFDNTPRPPTMMAIGPDGTLFVATDEAIWRLPDSGGPVLVAGYGAGRPEDGKIAWETALSQVYQVAVSPDGALYFVDRWGVFRVNDDGRLTAILDRSSQQHRFRIAPAADGVVYVADRAEHRVYRIGPDGKRTVVAGNGEGDVTTEDDYGDGGAATDAVLPSPSDVAVADDHTIYVASFGDIRRIAPNGEITTIHRGSSDSDGTVGPTQLWGVNGNGDLYFSQDGRIAVIANPAGIGFWADMLSTLAWAGALGVLAGAGYLVFRHRALAKAKPSSQYDPWSHSWSNP